MPRSHGQQRGSSSRGRQVRPLQRLLPAVRGAPRARRAPRSSRGLRARARSRGLTRLPPPCPGPGWGCSARSGGREDREGRSRQPADSGGAAGPAASSGAGGRRGRRPAHRVGGRRAGCAGARDSRAAGRRARAPGRPRGSPLPPSLPGPGRRRTGLRRRSLTGGRPRAGVGVRHSEVCRRLRGSPPGPPLGPAAAAETAAGTARAQGAAGPSGCSGEGAGPGAAQNPLSSPPPPPLPSPGCTRPLAGTRGAREGHGTRCLPCVGSRRQEREQGRAK